MSKPLCRVTFMISSSHYTNSSTGPPNRVSGVVYTATLAADGCVSRHFKATMMWQSIAGPPASRAVNFLSIIQQPAAIGIGSAVGGRAGARGWYSLPRRGGRACAGDDMT